MALVGLGVLLVGLATAGGASAKGGPPSIAAGPAHGFVPSRNANHAGGLGGVSLLQWHNGPVMHAPTAVVPVYWGSSWGNSSFVDDKVIGLDALYSNIGGSPYAQTNGEYTDGSGHVDTTDISKSGDLTDTSPTPSGAPSTNQVLTEVAKMTNNSPVANAYYPVYSDQPRGNAGYCAWHSAGTINGIPVEFGFFFNLDGDPGCDPQAPASLNQSQGLSALANVSGHELSEMLTDPQLNAWYDQRGYENADKCAWTFSGLVTIGNQQWKIQGNWSNAAANTGSGYDGSGCIETSGTATVTAPAAPTLDSATAGNGTVTLTWTAPTDTGGGSISGYDIYRSTTSGGEGSTPIGMGGSGATSYLDTNLANGTTYYYTVAAVNSAGPGQQSSELSATPEAVALPGAPQGLQATTAKGRGVQLSWSPPSTGVVSSYNVYRTDSTGPIASTTSTSYKDTQTARGTSYTYYVTAVNSAGEGPSSDTSTATAK